MAPQKGRCVALTNQGWCSTTTHCTFVYLRQVFFLYTPFWPDGIAIGVRLKERTSALREAARKAQGQHAAAAEGPERDAAKRTWMAAAQRYHNVLAQYRGEMVAALGHVVGCSGLIGLPKLSGMGLRSSGSRLVAHADMVAHGKLERAVLSMAARRGINVVRISEWG